ncbi:MAG: penicillin-binding protein 2, partial [Pseudomonadota bacterium]
GQPGSREVVTNASGRILEELGYKPEPSQGKDVVITIDAELQRFAIERFGSESGAAVVMDVETGAILAFVSTPAFDPNDFVNGISQADYDVLRNNDRAPLYHKAYDGIYPPGSTFKMVVATAALESGVIDPQERIRCTGRYRFGNRTWACWEERGHGPMNMRDALKHSCDTYFYEVSKRVGIEKLAETAKKFGFGMTWPLGMTGGAVGVVPNDAWKRRTLEEPWFEGETLNIGIGQGYMTSTPLQLAVMTARIARGGSLVMPKMIHEGPQIGPNGDRRFDDTQQPLDPEHMRRMQDGMFAVTGEWGGTARRSGDLGLGGVFMAGKTGTAQVRYISQAERARGVIANEDLERRLRDHALFVGYAPHDNPQYAVSVIVEHGGGGSAAAAPVARDILAEAIRRDSRRKPTGQQVSSTGGSGIGGAL